MKHRIIFFILFLLAATGPSVAQEAADNPQPFDIWLEEFKRDAASQGISQSTLDTAFSGMELLPRVVELDRKQPEKKLTFAQYRKKIVSPERVQKGKDKLAEYRELLEKIGSEYNVPPQFIVALWGIETNYGSNTGGFSTIAALTTLAYDGRRSDFFRGELIKALRISDNDNIPPGDIIGSWAGAMGQCQFMPSSFFNFAVDYDQDGKPDIWNTEADVFASIANYLHASGWKENEKWGVPVTLPKKFDRALGDGKQRKTIDEWKKLGVQANGKTLPATPESAFLVLVGEGKAAAPYLVYDNYKVLLKWNRSFYFATATSQLADRIAAK